MTDEASDGGGNDGGRITGNLKGHLYTGRSLRGLLAGAVDSLCLRVNCINGITANAEHARDMVLISLGYKLCAVIAREDHETGKSLRTIVVDERKMLTAQKWDEVFSFENLIQPRFEP